MFLAVALRVRDPSQPNTVTEIKYSSLNSTAPDHGTTQAPRKHQVTACVTSFGTVQGLPASTTSQHDRTKPENPQGKPRTLHWSPQGVSQKQATTRSWTELPGNDLVRVRGVHRQPGDLPVHGQEAADALVTDGRPAIPANPHTGPQHDPTADFQR